VRRLALLTCLGLALFLVCGLTPAWAQNPQEYSAIDKVTPLKWANTLIFWAGLAYLIYRYAPPFFNARSADIQKAIEEATGLRIQGEFRRSEADRKMATLPAEIARIQREHDEALAREYQRVQRDTECEIERINATVTAEIDALRKDGVRRLRQRTAALAVDLAERHLQDRLASDRANYLPDFLGAVEHSGQPENRA